eukprot:TRINITY_DN3134_c0_g2_i1.p1 TRINITY_DN3134_c0_g2~~TRINITY_DN3134_c0_g2_i1.p1  ORF type:complete len:1133 (+),score=192.19 TRINITY_DN3134_c0_g2_i1:63-3461(+)
MKVISIASASNDDSSIATEGISEIEDAGSSLAVVCEDKNTARRLLGELHETFFNTRKDAEELVSQAKEVFTAADVKDGDSAGLIAVRKGILISAVLGKWYSVLVRGETILTLSDPDNTAHSVMSLTNTDRFVLLASKDLIRTVDMEAVVSFVSRRLSVLEPVVVAREVKELCNMSDLSQVSIIDLTGAAVSSKVVVKYSTSSVLLQEWDVGGLVSSQKQNPTNPHPHPLSSLLFQDPLNSLGPNPLQPPSFSHSSPNGTNIVVQNPPSPLAFVNLRPHVFSQNLAAFVITVIAVWTAWMLAIDHFVIIPLVVAVVGWLLAYAVFLLKNIPPPNTVFTFMSLICIILFDLMSAGVFDAWAALLIPIIASCSADINFFRLVMCLSVGWVMVRSLDDSFDFGMLSYYCADKECDTTSNGWLVNGLLLRLSVLVGVPYLVLSNLEVYASLFSAMLDFKTTGEETVFTAPFGVNTNAFAKLKRLLLLLRTGFPDMAVQGGTQSDTSISPGSSKTTPHASFLLPKNVSFSQAKVVSVVHVESTAESVAHLTMIPTIFETFKLYNGSVLSACGRGITGAFNASTPCSPHQVQACKCTLSIHSVFINQDYPNATQPEGREIPWNIGIATGIFSTTVMEQTTVITCQGIEQAQEMASLCLSIKATVLTTDKVEEVARHSFLFRPVDIVTFNKQQIETVYELLMRKSEATSWAVEQNCAFIKGFVAYRKGHFSQAKACFSEYLSTIEDVQAKRLYEAVCSNTRCCKTYVGWDNGGCEVQKATPRSSSQTSTTLQDRKESFLMSTESPAMTNEEDDVEIALKGAIKDAELDANVDQLIAWGLMPKEKASSVSTELPSKFVDHKNRIWQRANRPLGKGAFGEVWMGMDSVGGFVAIKTIQLPGMRVQQSARRRRSQQAHMKQVEDFVKEAALMSQLQHENIVTYIASAVVNNYVMIVMEYLSGGSLATVLQDFGASVMPLSSIRRYVTDIVAGLSFLHSMNIIHRDMKPHNVLIMINGRCKLADFGASAMLNKITEGTAGLTGTPLYMAPEAARGHACKASDVWGLGIIVCQLFTGKVPYEFSGGFPYSSHHFLYSLGGSNPPSPTIPTSLSSSAAKLAAACLRQKPSERPSAEDLLSEPFLVG